MGSPMEQDAISDKRASLSSPQRPRNAFCSTAGRRETAVRPTPCSTVGPETLKRGDLDADAVRLGIDVRLGRSDPERAHASESRQSCEDRVRQRLLEVEPARACNLFDFL